MTPLRGRGVLSSLVDCEGLVGGGARTRTRTGSLGGGGGGGKDGTGEGGTTACIGCLRRTKKREMKLTCMGFRQWITMEIRRSLSRRLATVTR